jgi:hypothetical protein
MRLAVSLARVYRLKVYLDLLNFLFTISTTGSSSDSSASPSQIIDSAFGPTSNDECDGEGDDDDGTIDGKK